MPDPETLALTGGPHDGRLVTVVAAPHNFRIPIQPNISVAEPDPLEPWHYGEYLPQTDKYGHISRNDRGELIYLWRGVQ